MARATRERYESNRPRAVLFEGPPGTGKTLCARILAARGGLPMVHVPVEAVMSKWFGESEKTLAAIFDACEELGGAIVFIDEVDALAGSRDGGGGGGAGGGGGGGGGMHEATRRVLSVLLQKVEGFDAASGAERRTTLVAATNRRQDLDAALLSRFNLSIRFELPDGPTRAAIFARYARQLTAGELGRLAAAAVGISPREIKEVCEDAERKWASVVLREVEAKQAKQAREQEGQKGQQKKSVVGTPPFEMYEQSLAARRASAETTDAARTHMV